MKKFLIVFFVFYSCFAKAQDDSTAKDLAEVVVTGQYQPQSLKHSVYQVRVINQQFIKASGAASIQQVLQTQVGFRFYQDNALGVADIELMGMGGRNVKILLDGVPLVDRGDTRESLSQIDINQVERIEIIEGPLSVIYGSDALAGVINIITKKVSKGLLDVQAKIQEETAGNEYHPFHFKGSHQQALQVGLNGSNFYFSAGLTHLEFSGWGGDVYGRDKAWLPREQWMGLGKIGYKKDRFHIYYRIDVLDELIKDRGPINLDNFRSVDKRYFSDRLMQQAHSEWTFHNHLRWNSMLSFTNYKRRTQTMRHNFQTGAEEPSLASGEQDLSEVNSFVARNTLVWKISKNLSVQPGIEIQHESASGNRISGKPAYYEYAAFATGEINALSWLQIRPGLRVLHHSIYDGPPIIPSLNTRIVLDKKTLLRGAWSRGFRSPSLRELYFDFRDANHYILGNKDLEAEHSQSVSITVSRDWNISKTGLQSSLQFFHNRFRNLITLGQDPSDPQVYTTLNLDRFRTTGFSFETNALISKLEVRAGFSYLGRYNIYGDDEKYADQELPLYSWTPEASASFIYTWLKPGIGFSFIYKFSGTRPGYVLGKSEQSGAEEVQQVTLDSYHWADAMVRKTFCGRMELQAGIKNLFNVREVNSNGTSGGTHSNQGAQSLGYGRSFVLGLNYRFIKNK